MRIRRKCISVSRILNGFNIILFFVYLSGFELARQRVLIRVSKGGHNIPPDVIQRRYFKGIKNFSGYAEKVNDWYIYDNSGPEFVLIAKSLDKNKVIFNFEVYHKLLNHAGE